MPQVVAPHQCQWLLLLLIPDVGLPTHRRIHHHHHHQHPHLQYVRTQFFFRRGERAGRRAGERMACRICALPQNHMEVDPPAASDLRAGGEVFFLRELGSGLQYVGMYLPTY
ncbi:hypothetical protein F4779DRAFT_596866 [Xylariaceae sp. FL0662B]|nr:hypothetical protein F4779DRAFT_596866 [Xylariaceae sp. FL0662B]